MTFSSLLCADPGLGQSRPRYGTGLVILEPAGRRWRAVHSELVEARTDREDDRDIRAHTGYRLQELGREFNVDLIVIEGVSFQGAERANQTIRLALLVGHLEACAHRVTEDPAKVVLPTRSRVLAFCHAKTSEEADLMTRRLIVNPDALRSEHEVTASAAGIVGFEMWRAAELVRARVAQRRMA